MAKKLKIKMVQGDSHEIVATVVNEEGIAISLADCALAYVIKRGVRAATNYVSKSAGAGILVIDNALTIVIEPEDTNGLIGRHYHECELTLPFGEVYTLFTGSISFIPSGV